MIYRILLICSTLLVLVLGVVIWKQNDSVDVLIESSSVGPKTVASNEFMRDAALDADKLYASFGNRIPNLRRVVASNRYEGIQLDSRSSLAFGFLERDINSGKYDTYFIGSSFLWGYPLKEEYTIPYYYGELYNENTRSFALYGSGLIWSRDFSCYLKRREIKLSKLVVSIPFTNDLGRQTKYYAKNNSAPPKWTDENCIDYNSKVSLEEAVYDLTLDEYTQLLVSDPNNEPRKKFSFNPLNDGYFVSADSYSDIRNVWLHNLRYTISSLSESTDDLTVVLPTVFMPAVERAGYSKKDLQAQIDDIIEVCEEIASEGNRVNCFSVGDNFNNSISNFGNLTHLNDVGYKEYVRLLFEYE